MCASSVNTDRYKSQSLVSTARAYLVSSALISSSSLIRCRSIRDAHWCTLVDRRTLLRSVILDGAPMHPRCRLVTAFDAGRVRMSDRSVAGLGGYPGCGGRRQGYAPLSAVQ